MQLTEQQRAELERREWRPDVGCGEFQMWVKTKIGGGCIAVLYADGFFTCSGDPSLAAEFLAVAGYQPSGYCLVPVEEYRYLVGTLEEYDEAESQIGNYSETRSEMIRRANARLQHLQQNGGEGR